MSKSTPLSHLNIAFPSSIAILSFLDQAVKNVLSIKL
ncbi:hypothetical protein [Sulfolobus tengchongensis spindle-shaped virus 3]|nr:hypothetical protein [Sulfolobus tengchongensis spindle-shaped virus 3]WDS52895.1 hypothetical protein [Sulfolobus tengchongensis spindle-shaped virus 4]